ncbi:MAG: ABC transporter ATP-binding protein/permease [Firmicutes bacterium]|nr:ABC transporter ATP-binding protein/permease [Bacillota bacterium]
MQKFKKTMQALKFLLSKVWGQKYGKIYILLRSAATAVGPFISIMATIYSGLLIDELTGERRIRTLVIYAVCMIVLPVVWGFINDVIYYICTTRFEYKINRSFEAEFYEHLSRLDYDFFDHTELKNLRGEAGEVVMNNFIGSVDFVCRIISTVLNLVLLLSLVTSLNLFVSLIILANVFLNYFISKKHKSKLIEYDGERHELWNAHWVYAYLLEANYYAKEVRLFNMAKLIINKLTKSTEAMDELKRKQDKTSRVAGGCTRLTGFIQNAFLYVYVIWAVLADVITVGRMSIFISAAGQLSGALNSFSVMYLDLYRDSAKVQKYIDFMNIAQYQCTTGDKEPHWDSDSVIEFRNVSFSYPGSDRLVIENLNLTIKANETLAIVGKNGSGKSTFVKLLTRLYVPKSGEILLNGLNIYEYDYYKYQNLFSPVFQDYNTYDMTVAENVALDDNIDKEKVEWSCRLAEIWETVEKMPLGVDTHVGTNIDPNGVEMSGGETQRLAIARARYHDREVYLLDEPTAALDPDAERKIYTQFHQMTLGKCAVLITHRLSAVQLADKVAVFDDGHVAEYGTHSELYAKGGIYRDMFDKQAEFYREA